MTVRLPQAIIEALNKIDKGKRAQFIRNAIITHLKEEATKFNPGG